MPGRAHHTTVKEAAHHFRQSIPEDGHWNKDNFQKAKDAHQQLLQKTKDLKDTTAAGCTDAKAGSDAATDNLTQHKGNVDAHAANVDAHAGNVDAHASNVDSHEPGSDDHTAATSGHDAAKNDHQQAQQDHQQAQTDCDQAQTDDDDSTDHSDGCDQNDKSAGTLHDTISAISDALNGIESSLGDSGEHEDKDIASSLCGEADTVIQKVEDGGNWHQKALDCDKPPAAPKPPTKTPTAPTPPAGGGSNS